MDDALMQSPLFASLDAEAAAALRASMTEQSTPRGTVIFAEGQIGDHMYVVVEGKIKLGHASPDGRESLMAVLGPGEIFGELSLFDPGPRTATATALTDARVLALGNTSLHPWLAGRPEVAEALLAALARRLRRTNDALADLVFSDVPGRVAKALLDLADRNHPLLRELEQEALGSYNHSVMVASLVERACRTIGADPLLGSVAALYHDIGKVRQPHFFIENQQGIANPHDGLEPEVSALIIMNHVVDGVELATTYRLPPEVVACIGSHHGTMLVKYFYEEAVERAGGDASAVDEAAFRYQGHRPRSREAAVLLLADSCEATTRAMAMSRGNLPREEIERTVDRLLDERRDDGQFDEADITLRELRVVRDTIVDSLVGIYHPRIAYPGARRSEPVDA